MLVQAGGRETEASGAERTERRTQSVCMCVCVLMRVCVCASVSRAEVHALVSTVQYWPCQRYTRTCVISRAASGTEERWRVQLPYVSAEQGAEEIETLPSVRDGRGVWRAGGERSMIVALEGKGEAESGQGGKGDMGRWQGRADGGCTGEEHTSPPPPPAAIRRGVREGGWRYNERWADGRQSSRAGARGTARPPSPPLGRNTPSYVQSSANPRSSKAGPWSRRQVGSSSRASDLNENPPTGSGRALSRPAIF